MAINFEEIKTYEIFGKFRLQKRKLGCFCVKDLTKRTKAINRIKNNVFLELKKMIQTAIECRKNQKIKFVSKIVVFLLYPYCLSDYCCGHLI